MRTVTCNLCSKHLSHNTSSTGAMSNHLRLKHSMVKLKEDQQQPSISGLLENMNKNNVIRKKANTIAKLIQDFLVANMLPFRTVETESFQNLICYFEPAYKNPF